MEQNQVTEREDPGTTPHLATPVKHPSCAPAPSRFLRTVAVIWTYLVSGAHHKLLTLHSRLSFRSENQVMLKLLQTTDNRSTFHLLHKVNCQRFPHWLQSHITHLAQRQRHLSAKPSVIRRSANPFAQLCGVKSVKNGNLTRSSLTLQFPWWTFIYLFIYFKSSFLNPTPNSTRCSVRARRDARVSFGDSSCSGTRRETELCWSSETHSDQQWKSELSEGEEKRERGREKVWAAFHRHDGWMMYGRRTDRLDEWRAADTGCDITLGARFCRGSEWELTGRVSRFPHGGGSAYTEIITDDPTVNDTNVCVGFNSKSLPSLFQGYILTL